jgi:hypothetical protein
VPPTEIEKVAYVFETELHFECLWFQRAWDELQALNLQGDKPMVADTNLHNLNVWSIVDRLLNHGVRIDRMLNPQNYASWDSRESRKARKWLSRKARASLPPGVFAEEELKAIRDSVEHLNERIPDFIAGRDINQLQPFLIGPLLVKPGSGSVSCLRGFNPFSGLCVVFGQDVDLNSLHRSVQALGMALPPLRVHTKLFLPPTTGSDSVEILRDQPLGHAHPEQDEADGPTD